MLQTTARICSGHFNQQQRMGVRAPKSIARRCHGRTILRQTDRKEYCTWSKQWKRQLPFVLEGATEPYVRVQPANEDRHGWHTAFLLRETLHAMPVLHVRDAPKRRTVLRRHRTMRKLLLSCHRCNSAKMLSLLQEHRRPNNGCSYAKHRKRMLTLYS